MIFGNQFKVDDKVFELFITEEKIRERVKELGVKLNEDLADENPLFIGLLNGAFIFAADLIREFKGHCEITFVKLSSYKGTVSTGKTDTLIGLKEDLKDRTIVIIEDITDTGNTLTEFVRQIKEQQPKQVKVASLLLKPEALKHPVNIDYLGFEIPNDFVIGYGLDCDKYGRNLKGIFKLKE